MNNTDITTEIAENDQLENAPSNRISLNEKSRLLSIYNQINNEDDIAMRLAVLLTGFHAFNTAIKLSNTVNGRQGKNRVTYSSAQRELMAFMGNDNIDEFEDRELMRLFTYILNQYLSDKQSLPENKPKLAAGIIGRVRTLIAMLLIQGQYSVIKELDIPTYIQDSINKAIEFIRTEQSNILNSWIQYLEYNESDALAEVVYSYGNEFWGPESRNAKSIFQSRFQGKIHLFRDYEETYQAYLKFRGEIINFSRNLSRSIFFEIFDDDPKYTFNKNVFDSNRQKIISEFTQLFNTNESSLAIQKLIYGN